MRRATGPRYFGPYKHGDKHRVHIVTGSGKARRTDCESFETRAAAEAFIERLKVETQGTTIRQAIDAFLEEKRKRGCVAGTLENYENRLWRLLGLPGNASRPVRWVANRGADLYGASAFGAPDTHIVGLTIGRMWGVFCVKAKFLKVDPFADVEANGRKRKGATKSRLTVNESRQLEAFCFAEPSDPDRVLTYAYLMLGKRAAELARVRVRDLDADGWLLRIAQAKTEAGVGDIPVPTRLRDMLLGLARDKAPDDLLFAGGSRVDAANRVRVVTKAAICRVVTPQELRRTFVDNARRQGFALREISTMTGHESSAVTERNYMSRAANDAGAVERNFKVIAGGKT